MNSSEVPVRPSGFARMMKAIVVAVSAGSALLALGGAAVILSLWKAVDAQVLRVGTEGRQDPLLVEAARHLGHAFVIFVAGSFLTLGIRRWRRNLIFTFLGLATVPVILFVIAWVRGVGTDGFPLTMSRVDPEASPWFSEKDGGPRIWWGADIEGAADFFNRPGFHPLSRTPLEAVTPEFRRRWIADREREAAAARAAAEEADRRAREKAEADAREAERRVAASVTATAEREAAALRKAAAEEAEATRQRGEAEAAARKAAAAPTPSPKPSLMVSDRLSLADEPTAPASPPSTNATAIPRTASRSIPLRWGATLRYQLSGASCVVRTDGPALIAVDQGRWNPMPENGRVIPSGGAWLFVRPYRKDTRTVTLTPLPGAR